MLRLDTKTGRAKLSPRPAPYYDRLSKGRYLGFRKLGADTGTWTARARTQTGTQTYKALGEESDVFSYDHAKIAAETWFRDLDREVTGLADDGKPATIESVCRMYVEDRRRQKGDAAAVEAERRFEREVYGGGGKNGDRHEAHEIAGTLIAKVRTRQIEAWRDGLVTNGLSKASANRTLTTLKAALNYAVKHRYVGADVAIEWSSVSPLKNAHRRRDLFLDLKQRRALLNAAEGAVRYLIEAAMLTGARAGELVSARRSQFDARTKMLTLTGKTGTRTIPLSPSAVALFAKLSKSKFPSAYLLTRDDGKPWAHSDWDELVRATATKAELPKGTCLYTLRHSWITAALMGSMSTLMVARLCGTSLMMIEKNYGHLAASAATEQLATLQLL
jgi:integrase